MARAPGPSVADGASGCGAGVPVRSQGACRYADGPGPLGGFARSGGAMSSMERARRITDFLARQGWAAGQRWPLAGDASFRRYERLTRGTERAVLMDAPPPQENVRAFMAIDRLLAGAGLAVPKIYGADEAAGLLLLEDLGDDTYTRLLARGGSESQLYELAVDLLIELHRRLPPEKLAGVPKFDDAMALRQVKLLLEWYWPATQGDAAPEAAVERFQSAWEPVL